MEKKPGRKVKLKNILIRTAIKSLIRCFNFINNFFCKLVHLLYQFLKIKLLKEIMQSHLIG